MTRPALVRSFVLTALAVVLALAGAMVVPAASGATPCRTAAEREAFVRQASRTEQSSHGVDLEVRILNLRVEFPWLKDLPVTPGRRIVISWLESGAGRE